MQYLFNTPIPIPWLLGDIAALLVTLIVVIFIIRKSSHPAVDLLEGFGFVFLYASLFENFAVVQGWYIYGRSFLMIGDVPMAVPLIEMDVLIVGLWLLQKMDIPTWCKPFIIGLFGMLQDFSLDPVATHQVFTVQGVTSGRWTWLLPPNMVNIYQIPVYNFPGWMLIMLYASIYILIGRWWFKHSGFKPLIGYMYPVIALFLALVTMVTPLSNFLLWLQPFGSKGSFTEWVMLAFHLLIPALLLVFFWRGRMLSKLTFKDDYPVLLVPLIFHLSDIMFGLMGDYRDILWLVMVASIVHIGLLGGIFWTGRGLKEPERQFSRAEPEDLKSV